MHYNVVVSSTFNSQDFVHIQHCPYPPFTAFQYLPTNMSLEAHLTIMMLTDQENVLYKCVAICEFVLISNGCIIFNLITQTTKLWRE